MKESYKQLLSALVMGMVVPGILLPWLVHLSGNREPAQAGKEEPPVITESRQAPPRKIPVLFSGTEVRMMDLEDYLCGVVLAEMPVSFAQEARKAQSVVARTYALRHTSGGGRHPGGAVCTDPNCCQGYLSPDEYLRRGGTEDGVEAMRRAVQATAGQVLTYEGELIEATYFSCSGGMTEEAAQVWGGEVPYLQAVPSPGEEGASHYSDSFTFSREEFCGALGLPDPGAEDFSLGQPVRTAGGGIDTMTVCGEVFTGVELRRLLKLPSTRLEIDGDGMVITVVSSGFGHRVGMSQYGADAMAAAGSTCEQILTHYYPGTVLTQWTGETLTK